jgi:mannose-6-phosphate isomerase-like protein (cupin superfamily)
MVNKESKMFNPGKHGAAVRNIPRSPRRGIKHSEIVKKRGIEIGTESVLTNKQRTPTGWKAEGFKSKSFEVYFELISAGNGTGTVVNETQDRFMRVLMGTVFVEVDGQINKLVAGHSVKLPRKSKYSISTSVDLGAEILFCQNPNYSKKLKVIAKPDLFTENEVSLKAVTKQKSPVLKRRKNSAAKKQALILKDQKEVRQKEVVRKATTPTLLTGQQAAGNSPMPITPIPE